MMKIVSAEPERSKVEDTLIPATMKKDEPSYFWSLEECIEFIKQLHAHGKKWKVISKFLLKRDALQCRSHGQKYLKAMEELQNIASLVTVRNLNLSEKNLLKIKGYEETCSSILESFGEENKNSTDEALTPKLNFFPKYLVEKYIHKRKQPAIDIPD